MNLKTNKLTKINISINGYSNKTISHLQTKIPKPLDKRRRRTSNTSNLQTQPKMDKNLKRNPTKKCKLMLLPLANNKLS